MVDGGAGSNYPGGGLCKLGFGRENGHYLEGGKMLEGEGKAEHIFAGKMAKFGRIFR
jgi:hypothetical protein